MSGVQFEIRVISGNSSNTIHGITTDLGEAATASGRLHNSLTKIGDVGFTLNNIRSAISGISDDFDRAVQPGIDFNSSLTDMQAITGVSNGLLKELGSNARQLAKDYGIDAAGAVESNKLLLSQLSPELANNATALDKMTRNAAILSKQLKGDTAAATEILTTALNQYGVSMDDPMAATAAMTDMMNIMSAAAKEGSAELPQIKGALEQAGMMAKTANVSFAELNSAIQVLDKSGKKGAEGGVALRNVMARLSEGQFMSRQSLDMLRAAGIDVTALADKSKSFADRLALLKPLVGDTAAMTQFFGTENVAAGIALINNTNAIGDLTTKITGTNTATEMADIAMGSFSERMARTNAWLKNMGISLFNATEGFIPFIKMGMGGLQMAANLGGAVQAVSIISDTKFGSAISKATTGTWNFVKSMGAATFGLLRQAVVMGASALTAVGSFIIGLVSATAAQLGLNIAMTANPIGMLIVGIGAAIAAVAVLITYWDEIKSAIASFGKWAAEHNPFNFLVDVVDRIFPGFKKAMTDLWGWVEDKFNLLFGWIGDAWDWVTGLFGGDGEGEKPAAPASASTVPGINGAAVVNTISPLAGFDPRNPTGKVKANKAANETASNITGGGGKSFNLVIHKLQDQTVIHTTNLEMGGKQAANRIIEIILEQFNGMNAALQGS